jgi:hypothetical protein
MAVTHVSVSAAAAAAAIYHVPRLFSELDGAFLDQSKPVSLLLVAISLYSNH